MWQILPSASSRSNAAALPGLAGRGPLAGARGTPEEEDALPPEAPPHVPRGGRARMAALVVVVLAARERGSCRSCTTRAAGTVVMVVVVVGWRVLCRVAPWRAVLEHYRGAPSHVCCAWPGCCESRHIFWCAQPWC